MSEWVSLGRTCSSRNFSPKKRKFLGTYKNWDFLLAFWYPGHKAEETNSIFLISEIEIETRRNRQSRKCSEIYFFYPYSYRDKWTLLIQGGGGGGYKHSFFDINWKLRKFHFNWNIRFLYFALRSNW